MLKFIAERRDRLYATCAHLGRDLVVQEPLLIGIKLTDWQFHTLLNYINIYLYDSLNKAVGCDVLCDDMLLRHEFDIKHLQNITPNGLLLPKRHNLLSYNLMLGHVTGLIASLDLKGVARLHSPINVRIINGTPNQEVDQRPRASVKLHTDIWAGELSNHIMIFIPLAGDMHHNGVELYEPGANFYPDYVRSLSNFDEGNHLIDGATQYRHDLGPGLIYLLDSFLLHRTMKRLPGLRMVINFAFIPEESVTSDLPTATDRSSEYIQATDWYNLGHRGLVVTDSEMRDYSVAETGGPARDRYADDYRVVEI